MGGTLIVSGKKVGGFRRDHAKLVIGSGELADGIERFPESDRDEFRFVTRIPAQNVAAFVTGDPMNPGQDALQEHVIINGSVFRFRVAMPKSRDHGLILPSRSREAYIFLLVCLFAP